MQTPDAATVRALRADMALQIARHIQRSGRSQVAAAKQLGIPQPTLSKIANGNVSALSLELLIRIAVRAGLPVVLQTGKAPQEAGVFVASRGSNQRTSRSRVADEARAALTRTARRMTAAERLEAQLTHSELMTKLHRAGRRAR